MKTKWSGSLSHFLPGQALPERTLHHSTTCGAIQTEGKFGHRVFGCLTLLDITTKFHLS